MGFLGDVIGRTSAMTVTLSIVCLSATMSAAIPSGNPINVYSIIIVARFFLGIGVGGIYPLSAIKAAEDGGKGGDSVDVASAAYAFFWQVPGAMTPWFLALIFSYSSMTADIQWRLLLGLGAVPSAFVVLCSILENHRSKKLMIGNDRSGTALRQGRSTDELMESAKSRLIGDILSQRETWTNLLVTGGCWFLYDVAYCKMIIMMIIIIIVVMQKQYYSF
jgi:PHS family inorganic phosphate transporter-like MFS transporter